MKRSSIVVVLLLGVAACSGIGDSPDAKTKIVPVEDPFAKDTTPPPPPPRTSRLEIMDSLPLGGVCEVVRYARGADASRQLTYEVGSPRRTYVVEVGKPPRAFLPVSIDIRGTHEEAGLTETENVFVGFKATGGVSVGTRRYMASGTTMANERDPLMFGDSAKAIEFVLKILETCG